MTEPSTNLKLKNYVDYLINTHNSRRYLCRYLYLHVRQKEDGSIARLSLILHPGGDVTLTLTR